MRTAWVFEHSYAKLPSCLHLAQYPLPVTAPALVAYNDALAESLGLGRGDLGADALARIFSGNDLADGMHPIAQAYAGHQFGHFTMLGDGRVLLLGEILDPNGCRHDIQLKGSGPTPFSRDGDGRAHLGPMLREYILSEAMAGLCIPTTRSLAVVTTGEPVYRPHPLPGAILTRLAQSHIRVGTFEYCVARRDIDALSQLADYVMDRHYPAAHDAEHPPLALLSLAVRRQACLLADWMSVGFIHGVMNTDNMSIAGETIDYGPCAFMDEYDPDAVFSSIDHAGRYRYCMQPSIAKWNLARFAETLLPLLGARGMSSDTAIASLREALDLFDEEYDVAWLSRMAGKLGLPVSSQEERANARSLTNEWLSLLAHHAGDFTNAHHAICEYAAARMAKETDPLAGLCRAERALFSKEGMARFLDRWWTVLSRRESVADSIAEMRLRNPVCIARNHRVESALAQAEQEGAYVLFDELTRVLARPFQEILPAYREPPAEHERVRQTYCGT